MIRLIASDIDGTLLQNGSTEISEEFFRQAERLIRSGICLCAASGRQYSSLRRLFAPLADRLYYICENGAVVMGPGREPKLLSRTVVDRGAALRLCRDILAVPDCELLISGVNTSYLVPKTAEYVDHIRYFVGNNTEILTAPEEMPEDFVKISAWLRAGAEKLVPLLVPAWGSVFHAAVAGQCWLDFTIADKSDGIRALETALGITPAEIMAFGDNYNDVPMLDAVGAPYIMDSAAEELRARYPRCRRPEDILARL